MTYNSSKTGAQVDGAVTDVQAAKAASPTDTTAGRLLKVGDFGLGGVPPTVADIDDNNLRPGFYRTTTTTLGTFPTGSAQFGILLVTAYDPTTGNVSQKWEGVGNNGTFRNRIWTRSYDVTLAQWNPWRELFHTGNTIVDVNGFIKEA